MLGGDIVGWSGFIALGCAFVFIDEYAHEIENYRVAIIAFVMMIAFTAVWFISEWLAP